MTQISESLRELGFAFLPRLRAGASSHDVARDLGHRSAGAIGEVHALRPSELEVSAPNTYSGRYGHGEFPFHTDFAHYPGPPAFLMLRCIRGYSQVTTRLIDGFQIVGKIGSSLLSRALVQARRPFRGALPLMTIWEPHVGSGQLRWDEEYLKPASFAGEEAMTQIADEIARSEPSSVALSEPGDTLVIDNRRVLHARAAVPPDCRDRVIERVYLEDIF